VDVPLRLGQRKRVAHIPTAQAARSGLILEGQRQARLHLKFNDPCPTNGVQFMAQCVPSNSWSVNYLGAGLWGPDPRSSLISPRKRNERLDDGSRVRLRVLSLFRDHNPIDRIFCRA
jgi:hypothetical protein